MNSGSKAQVFRLDDKHLNALKHLAQLLNFLFNSDSHVIQAALQLALSLAEDNLGQG